MKTVLHIALIAPGGYTARPFSKAFLDNGFSHYEIFDYQLQNYNFGKDKMQQLLIERAERMKPDLIFMQIQNSEAIDVDTYHRLANISFTVNFTFDYRNNEKTQWLYNLVPILGLVCFSSQDDVDECLRRGHENVMLLQSSFDEEVYKSPGRVERSGIVFIGNNTEHTNLGFELSKDRREMVDMLHREFPEQFVVHGMGWSIGVLADQKTEVEAYQKSLIVINQNHFYRDGYTSDRLWRAMACGAFVLTKYFKGVEKMFDRFAFIDWWKDLPELKAKVQHYLVNPNLAVQIGAFGHQRVDGLHRWSNRIGEMIQAIGGLVKTENTIACKEAHTIGGIIPGARGNEDAMFDGKECDCGKLKGLWAMCECGNKEYQFRWVQNV